MDGVGQADEEQLVRLIAHGDRAAFEELYRRTAPWLAVRLRRRCADDDVVAEVMQETYLAVWRAAAAFTGPGSGLGGSATGWLWTIAARRLVGRVPSAGTERAATGGGPGGAECAGGRGRGTPDLRR